MERILREPVELIDSDLDEAAGGVRGSFNGNGKANGSGNLGLLSFQRKRQRQLRRFDGKALAIASSV